MVELDQDIQGDFPFTVPGNVGAEAPLDSLPRFWPSLDPKMLFLVRAEDFS